MYTRAIEANFSYQNFWQKSLSGYTYMSFICSWIPVYGNRIKDTIKKSVIWIWMNHKKKVFLSFFLISFFAVVGLVYAVVTITSGTWGTNISADKAGNASTSGRTTLDTLSINSAENNDFATGQTNVTLILTAPTNWRFMAWKGTALSTGAEITVHSIVVTSATITVEFTRSSNDSSSAGIMISDIQVQAITGNIILSTSKILRTLAHPGTATIANITNNYTNFWSLSQVAGIWKNLIITMPGQTFIAWLGNSGSAENLTAWVSFTIVQITAVDQFQNIVTTYTWNKTLAYTWQVWTHQYTSWVDFTTGQSTTLLTSILNIHATGVTLTVTDGILTWIASSSFSVRDTLAPIVTLKGSSTVNVEYGDKYSESGATWTDNLDGSWSIDTPISGSVNTWVLGTYILIYNTTDVAGNSWTINRTVIVKDTTAPVTTLNGTSTVNIEFGNNYTELGATQTDAVDGSWTITTPTSGSVDTWALGTYILEYYTIDSSGNTGNTVTRTVIVRDTTAPIINLMSLSPTFVWTTAQMTITANSTDLQGVSGVNAIISWNLWFITGITLTLVSWNTQNGIRNGTYTFPSELPDDTYDIFFIAIDNASNTGYQNIGHIILDRSAPILSIIAITPPYVWTNNTATITVSAQDISLWIDSITAKDRDTDIVASLISGTSLPTTAGQVGTWIFTQFITWSQAPHIEEINIRDVMNNAKIITWSFIYDAIIPTTIIEYSITGLTNQNVLATLTWYSEAITITNNWWSNIYVFTGNENFVFEFKDRADNIWATLGNVTRINKTSPVVILNWSGAISIEYEDNYIELWATRTDDVEGSWTISIPTSGSIHTWVLGTYILEYSKVDRYGNTGNSVTRTINIVDTTKPVITLIGNSEITVEVHSSYVDSWVMVSDNYDGKIKTGIFMTNPPNMAIVGKYIMTYDVADAQGNTAIQVYRIIHVVNSFKPMIVLSGDNPQIIELWNTYTELWATASDHHYGNITTGIIIDAWNINLWTIWSYTVFYKVTNTDGNTGTEMIRTVHIQAPSKTAPVAIWENFTTDEDVILTVDRASGVLPSHTYDANDDALQVIINTTPTHGTLTIHTGDWSFSYLPEKSFNGTDHFTYYINNWILNSNLITGTITVISNNIVNIDSDTSNQESIINEFLNNWYQNWTGALIENTSGVYVWSQKISTESSSGKILIPFILQSSGTDNKIEMEVPAGVIVKKQDWNAFTGIINLPIIQDITIATWVPKVLAVADFSNNQNEPLYFKDIAGNPINIQLNIPVPEAKIGDIVNVYYSHTGATWIESEPTHIIYINGQPYVSIQSTHLTIFAIGATTWTFVINNDTESTTSRIVEFNISASWIQNMQFSNTGASWPRSDWEVYSSTKRWTLSTGHGIKTGRAQFDTDGNTGTVEANTEDSINYTGAIGLGYCDYGNTLNFGTTWYASVLREINSQFSTMSGNTAWFCDDIQGAAPRTLSIQSSDLINTDTKLSGQTIAASNIAIRNPAATVAQWVCTANAWSSSNARRSIDIATVILGKSESTEAVCKITTSQLDLKVTIPAYQALGQYSGTLTITIPSL